MRTRRKKGAALVRWEREGGDKGAGRMSGCFIGVMEGVPTLLVGKEGGGVRFSGEKEKGVVPVILGGREKKREGEGEEFLR